MARVTPTSDAVQGEARKDPVSAPTSPSTPWTARLLEPITLTHAERAAAQTPDAARASVKAHLALARQKADASETLLEAGHLAEAIQLGRQAYLEVIAAAEDLATDDEPEAEPNADEVPAADVPPLARWRAPLAARGVSASDLEAIGAVASVASGSAWPTFDGEVGSDDEARLRRLLSKRAEVDRALAHAGDTPLEIRSLRLRRRVLLALGLSAVAAILVAVLRPTPPRPVTASARFGPEFGEELAIDGRPDTEWLLPDHQDGWIELSVDPPRRIERVAILNAHNPPHNDRATTTYAIEVYAGSTLARTIDGRFAFSASPQPVTTDIGVEDVERIRVNVRSVHGLGGGLAEITLE